MWSRLLRESFWKMLLICKRLRALLRFASQWTVLVSVSVRSGPRIAKLSALKTKLNPDHHP